MKAIFENQYIQSKAMIREYAGKIVIRKYKKKACFVAALGLVLLLISLLNQNLIMTGVAAACTIICIAVILFLPGLFVKEIEKNTTFLNGDVYKRQLSYRVPENFTILLITTI